MFRHENGACDVCLGYRKKWTNNNPEKLQTHVKYGEERKEENKYNNKEYIKLEYYCEVSVCNVRK